jgi:PAS domain S-box-containing protein
MTLSMDTPRADGLDIKGVPILIVDDDERKRFVLRSVLAPQGYAIREASSGAEALRCVMAEDFAVILMDIRMPEMDGFETAQLVRKRQRSELTPVIFITGYGSEAEANVAAYDAGAADFIYSPVPPQQLRAKVGMFANLYVRAQHLAKQAKNVRERAGWLTQVTDAAPIGIFLTDEHQRYVYVNPRWTEITGIAATDALGRSWDIIRDPQAGECAVDGSPLAAGAGETATAVGLESTERFVVARHGTRRRIVERSARPLPSTVDTSDQDRSGWVGTLSDVTDEIAAKTELAAARDTALAANLAQVNFAASASHELKTPTASILGFIEEVLQNDALDDDDRSYLDIAYRNARRLVTLIDDLTIVGEVELGAARITLEPVAVVPVVHFVISSLSATANTAGVTLEFGGEPEPESPVFWAVADQVRLEQVLTNLVGNAVKFTPSGGRVTVTVGYRDDVLWIDVTDTGIGIDDVSVQRIFDRFYRTPVVLESGIRGSGLGLAIARRMTEAQGGAVAVRSVMGEGSTFTVTLVPATAPASTA